MSPAAITALATLGAATIAGLFALAARKLTPRVSRQTQVVNNALALAESHRIEHEQDVAELKSLREQLKQCRDENDQLRRAE